MVKAIVLKEDQKVVLVAQVQELSTDEFVKLEKSYLKEREQEIKEKLVADQLVAKRFSDLEKKVEKLERQLAYDHGEIESLEEEK